LSQQPPEPQADKKARFLTRDHLLQIGTLLFVVALVAVVVFSTVDGLFAVVFGHQQGLLERFATHLAVLPVIGGVGFELLKLSGRTRHHAVTRALVAPGLWLQRITTREPDDGQLEVGLTALHRALAAVQGEGASLPASGAAGP